MKKLLLVFTLIFAFAISANAQQPQKHFDKFSYFTIALNSTLSVIDGEKSARHVANGGKELNRFFVNKDGSFNRAKFYGINAAFIGTTVLLQRLHPAKDKRKFDWFRVGLAGAQAVVITVTF